MDSGQGHPQKRRPSKTVLSYWPSTSPKISLRFHRDLIYVADAGAPGLILLNQKTGVGRRVLDNDTSTTARHPMCGEGKKMVKPDGSSVALHADQMEVSPDGKHCYF